MTPTPPDEESRESVADLVGEIVKMRKEQATEVSARRVKKPKRSQVPLLTGLTVVAVGLTIWNLSRAVAAPPPVRSVDREATALVGIRVAAMALDAYKDSAGTYPATLADVSADGFDVIYALLGSAYEISVPVDTGIIKYRSGEPLPDFSLIMQAIRSE